jgi:pectinesterase
VNLLVPVGLTLALLSPAPTPSSVAAVPPADAVVALDGSGDFTTIQAAVDAVPAGNTAPFVIGIRPGTYHGQVIIPANKPFVSLRGWGRQPSDVIITDDRANGTLKPDGTPWGTSGSASVTISGHDFSATNLTFANDFDEAAHPEITNRQAVAVKTRADRIVFDRVRFIGNQDTLYIDSPDVATVSRVLLKGCYVEGDVDFIFGRGTAVFEGCVIHSLDRGSTTNNGYVTAASTDIHNPHGFLFTLCLFTGSAPAGTVSLGRPWHPSNDPNAIAQVVVRDSWLGEHIVGASPWTDFGPFSWRDARYDEFHTIGPGVVDSPDRPRLTPEQAADFQPRDYLTGADNWRPAGLLPF